MGTLLTSYYCEQSTLALRKINLLPIKKNLGRGKKKTNSKTAHFLSPFPDSVSLLQSRFLLCPLKSTGGMGVLQSVHSSFSLPLIPSHAFPLLCPARRICSKMVSSMDCSEYPLCSVVPPPPPSLTLAFPLPFHNLFVPSSFFCSVFLPLNMTSQKFQ